MLPQNHAGEVELLPALPLAWQKGFIHTLIAKGGFEVSINRENGILKEDRLTSRPGTPLKLSYKDKITMLEKTGKGKSCILSGNLLHIN